MTASYLCKDQVQVKKKKDAHKKRETWIFLFLIPLSKHTMTVFLQ